MTPDAELLRCANAIARNVRGNFANTHLSGNLMNTVSVYANKDGSVSIRIPAPSYDIARFKKEKAIVFKPENGSYAQKVNVTGGFSKTHVSYVEGSIAKGVMDAFGGRVKGMEFKS